jgi:hypothetical protein
MRIQRRATPVRELSDISRPGKLSFGPRLRRQALRLRRTAVRLWGLTARHGQTKTVPLMEVSVPIAHLAGECATGRPSLRSLMPT